jgi:hypothetical protein
MDFLMRDIVPDYVITEIDMAQVHSFTVGLLGSPAQTVEASCSFSGSNAMSAFGT